MAIKIGNNDITFKVGSADCTVYLGETLMYSGGSQPTPPSPYYTEYLTFVVEQSGTIMSYFQFSYSLDDGSTWSTVYGQYEMINVNAGDKVLIKDMVRSGWAANASFNFMSGSYSVEGNIMSLLFGDNFIGQTDLTGYNHAFDNLFENCSRYITSFDNLVLPATTLSEGCYYQMFEGCTSLTTAPQLPATTLAKDCYYQMFDGCTNLNSITCLATDISATQCTENWAFGVASSGTFIKNPSMTSWSSGNSGIPSNWTVVDYTG